MSNREATLQESISRPEEDVRLWQQQLVRGVLRVIVIIAPLAIAAGSYYAITSQTIWYIPFYVLAYGALLLVTFWKRVPYAAQAGTLLALVYLVGATDFLQDGRGGSGRVFLLAFAAMGALLLGRRGGAIALTLAMLTVIGFAVAFSLGWITIPAAQEVRSNDVGGWLSNSLVLFLLGTFLVASQNFLVPRLASALALSRQLANDLAAERANLERAVADRTSALSRRTTQLEAAAQVAREAAAIRSTTDLLNTVVRLISDRFGFYHAGIFLTDEAGEYAVLSAASSEGGRRMLARGHRLRVGVEGIVGYTAGYGEPRIALDVGADAVFFNNPDLPETRSEMALPLRARDQIIGVLDVQSTEPAAFTQEDVAVLQTLADQVAVAISNARLFEQSVQALEAERRAYGELSRQAWQRLLRTSPTLQERYDPQGLLSADGHWQEKIRAAAQTGSTVIAEPQMAAVPIKVRGHVIGVLEALKPEGAGEWTPDEISLLETLTEQLGIALESARLYHDTQRRAAQERLVSDIATRLRASLDPETVLKTTVRELGQALGAELTAIEVTGPVTNPASEGKEK